MGALGTDASSRVRARNRRESRGKSSVGSDGYRSPAIYGPWGTGQQSLVLWSSAVVIVAGLTARRGADNRPPAEDRHGRMGSGQWCGGFCARRSEDGQSHLLRIRCPIGASRRGFYVIVMGVWVGWPAHRSVSPNGWTVSRGLCHGRLVECWPGTRRHATLRRVGMVGARPRFGLVGPSTGECA